MISEGDTKECWKFSFAWREYDVLKLTKLDVLKSIKIENSYFKL